MQFSKPKQTKINNKNHNEKKNLDLEAGKSQKDCDLYRCLPTRHVYLLTPALFLQPTQAFLLSPTGFFCFLVLPTLVKVLHHHPDKHVEHKEADDEEEGDKVEEHPWVVVLAGLVAEVEGEWGERERPKRRTRLETSSEEDPGLDLRLLAAYSPCEPTLSVAVNAK